jgi:hypothetical protein
MPSFYGAFAWGFWLTIYLARVIDWYPDDPDSIVIYIFVELVFIASIFAFARSYRDWLGAHLNQQEIEQTTKPKYRRSYKKLIVIFHAVGFYGIYQYMHDFGASIGGIQGFWDQTMNQAYLTRLEAEYTTSIGTQVSYIGWLAIGITVFEVVRGRLSRWWLVPAILQFAVNLLWIGRIRPFTVLFMAALMALVALQAPRFVKVVKWGTLVVGGMIGLFWAVAIWVGKLAPWSGFNLPNVQNFFNNFAGYGTGGFAYFNQMVVHGVRHSFIPENSLYPFFKVLAALNFTGQPPSQIKPFLAMPYSTNVSTFLDPFYRDGGFPLLILGILIQSFGVDALGLSLLRPRNPLGYIGWTILCFTSFMSFFAFKICEFSTWLLVAIGMVGAWLYARRRRANVPLGIQSMQQGAIQRQINFQQRSMRIKR